MYAHGKNQLLWFFTATQKATCITHFKNGSLSTASLDFIMLSLEIEPS
jgi:hypothetical protein